MGQGSRPDRVGDLIREELCGLLTRSVKDPGVGFVTITRVQVTPDLQHARVYFTVLGDETQRRESTQALTRAASFLRREIGRRVSLKRSPALTFMFDESIAHQHRIEQLLEELQIDSSETDPPKPAEPDDE